MIREFTLISFDKFGWIGGSSQGFACFTIQYLLQVIRVVVIVIVIVVIDVVDIVIVV